MRAPLILSSVCKYIHIILSVYHVRSAYVKIILHTKTIKTETDTLYCIYLYY